MAHGQFTEILCGGFVVASREFGLVGAQVRKITGPFFDTHDFKKNPKDERLMDNEWLELAGRRLLRARNLSECVTNWVDTDLPYISEDFTEEHIDSLVDKGFIHCTEESAEFHRLYFVYDGDVLYEDDEASFDRSALRC